MQTPKTLAEAVAAFENEVQKNTVLTEELATVGKDLQALASQFESANAAAADYKRQTEALAQEIENLKAEQASVDQKVAAALASIAVPPVASVQQTEPQQTVSARERLSQIKDPMARAIFRRDHFDELLKNR